jgi:hypothetical protein
MTTHGKIDQIRKLVHAELFVLFVMRMRDEHCHFVRNARVAILGYSINVPIFGRQV